MIQKVDHFVITTAHLDACLDFYRRLGFRCQAAPARYELYAGDFKINVHELCHELEPKAGQVQAGSADFCLEVTDDLSVLYEQWAIEGSALDLGVVERHGVGGRMQSLYLRDPDGNLIELCHYE